MQAFPLAPQSVCDRPFSAGEPSVPVGRLRWRPGSVRGRPPPLVLGAKWNPCRARKRIARSARRQNSRPHLRFAGAGAQTSGGALVQPGPRAKLGEHGARLRRRLRATPAGPGRRGGGRDGVAGRVVVVAPMIRASDREVRAGTAACTERATRDDGPPASRRRRLASCRRPRPAASSRVPVHEVVTEDAPRGEVVVRLAEHPKIRRRRRPSQGPRDHVVKLDPGRRAADPS